MKNRTLIDGKTILDIYSCTDGRYWFVTERLKKNGQQFLSGYVRSSFVPMLAKFSYLPEGRLNNSDKRIWRVSRKTWHLCPEINLREINETQYLHCPCGKVNFFQDLKSYSSRCKEVDNKMDAKMKEKLNAYLELLDEISEKTDDESTALALLQEISKDRRMEKIREEQNSRNGDEPATDKQKKFMTKLGIEFTDDITKKQASFMIDAELGKTDSD